MKNNEANKELKNLVGQAAAGLVQNGMVCGIGTGSTVAYFITALSQRIQSEGLEVTGVPTSFQSRLLCQTFGIPIREPQDYGALDLAIDGADEVDPDLNLIKGGGAAHTREKIVATMARRFIVIVDESKLVAKLGSKAAVPIEIIPTALTFVSDMIRRWGGDPTLRMGLRKDGPVVTDNGQLVIDARFASEQDLRQIDRRLHETPGVIETGLFFDLTAQVLVGSAQTGQVQTLLKKNKEV